MYTKLKIIFPQYYSKFIKLFSSSMLFYILKINDNNLFFEIGDGFENFLTNY